MATKGKAIMVKIPGTATAMVGEATTEDATTKIYAITATAKQVLQPDGAITVHKYDGTPKAAAAGTTTTALKLTGHGIAAGGTCLIINTTRANAKRIATYVDADTLSVAAVTSQAEGDTIHLCPNEAPSGYILDRLKGTVTYAGAASRVIYVSGNYLPLSEIGGAKEISIGLSADNQDVTVFGKNFIVRQQGQKDISVSISGFYLTGANLAFLTGDKNVLIEFYIDRTSTWHIRLWSRMSSEEISGAVDGVVEESLDLEGDTDNDRNAIAFN